jgi:hypothetical protein
LRELSDYFMSSLKNGMLNSILEFVRKDYTLDLEIRYDYINIYYRGGNLMKLELKGNNYILFFDENYCPVKSKPILARLPKRITSSLEAEQWVAEIPQLKHCMDLFFYKYGGEERERQQLIIRENNYSYSNAVSRSTDYYICDMEYETGIGKPDLIGVRWESTSSAKKKNTNLRLALIEAKNGDGSLDNFEDHIKHANDICQGQYIDNLKKDMIKVFNQKRALGLIDCDKDIVSFSEEKPEYIFALINHDPSKSELAKLVGNVKACSNIEIKFATSNFMGYGLYIEGIYGLEEFKLKYDNQICNGQCKRKIEKQDFKEA